MNKYLLLFLACVVPLQLYSNLRGFKLDGIYYTINGDEAIVSPGPFALIAKTDIYGNEEYSRDYVGDVVIPESAVYDGKEYRVTEIGEMAFWMCRDLTSVTIPSSIVTIGDEAFYDCISLRSITIPESVTSIGNRIIYGCNGLESIFGPYASEDHRLLVMDGEVKGIADHGLSTCIVPDNVTHIGFLAFAYCGFSSIILPESVTQIEGSAFSHCLNLESIIIPNSITKIEDFTFSNCRKLKDVVLSATLTEIGGGCFEQCENLQSIDIPNSVKKIKFLAFEDCNSLKSVIIPESVTSIGSNAFSKCKNLKSVIVKVPNPNDIYMDTDVFINSNTDDCVLQVPAGSVDLYRNAPQWRDFKSIVEIPDAALNMLQNDDDCNSAIYDLTGMRVTMPQDGKIYIVNGKKIYYRNQQDIIIKQ